MRKAVLGVVAVLCWVGVASAVSVPELKATVERNGNVRVKWSFDGSAVRETTEVEIQRSADGKSFAPLVTVKRARKKQNYLDRVKGAGPFAYRARVVTPDGTTGWSVVSSTGDTGTGSGGGGGGSTTTGGCPAGSEADVLTLVNAERAKYGVAALENSTLLAVAAGTRSTQMAATGNLTHDGWVDVIRAAGYRGSYLGENIAYGYGSAGAVVKGWMGSDGHRANILRSTYVDSGVGCVKDARGRLWWTQDFGR
jgi:uncharacterized protein YkwD